MRGIRSDPYQDQLHPGDHPNYMLLRHRLNDGLAGEIYGEYRVKGNEGTASGLGLMRLWWIEPATAQS